MRIGSALNNKLIELGLVYKDKNGKIVPHKSMSDYFSADTNKWSLKGKELILKKLKECV